MKFGYCFYFFASFHKYILFVLILIRYHLQLAVDPGFCSVNLSVKLPIMIGTVAIINGSSGYECNPMCNPTGPISFSTRMKNFQSLQIISNFSYQVTVDFLYSSAYPT